MGGNTVQDQRVQVQPPASGVEHATPRDPRFANAPLTDAEKKTLYEARTPDEGYASLGRFQEEREQDSRLPPAIPTGKEPLPLDRRWSADQQVAKGAKPTAEELAYIEAGPNTAAQQDRTKEFLAKRKELNEQLFQQSRRWGTLAYRQAHPDAPSPDAERQWGPRGIQGWRAQITDAVYRSGTQRNATVGRPPSLDPRCEDAPITPAEITALKATKTPEAAAELLSRFCAERVNDGRLPEPSKPQLEKTFLCQILTPSELNRLGLMPTARDLDYLQAAATDGWEPECTLEFIADRHAQNARWHLDAQYAAQQQERLARDGASSYWYDRVLVTRSAERDARTERGERRTDLQQLREQATQLREGAPRTDGNAGQPRDGCDGGGGRGR